MVRTALLLALALGAGASGQTTDRATAPALVPSSIAFWNGSDGLIGTGRGCCAGTVSVTSDSGRTYHVVLRTSRPVKWVATAGSRSAWAVVGSRLLGTIDRGRHWRQLSTGQVTAPAFASRTIGYAVGKRGLLATSTGGRSWHAVRAPCRVTAVSSPVPGRLWALCAGLGGAGQQEKTLYESGDRGRTWHPRAPSGGLPTYGYALGIAFAPDGAGLLWESRGRPYLTRDGGRHWRPWTFSSAMDVYFGDSAAVLSRTVAFVLVDHAAGGRQVTSLLETRDGGKRWSIVKTWFSAPR
jgi:photosystem II stability/assembly factor-like uncharacterized protein